MGYANIIVEIGDDFVAEITLNRPESLNTFNVPLARELDQALQELDAENCEGKNSNFPVLKFLEKPVIQWDGILI